MQPPLTFTEYLQRQLTSGEGSATTVDEVVQNICHNCLFYREITKTVDIHRVFTTVTDFQQ